MTLNSKCFDEETWLIVPSTENNNDQQNLFQEDENLDKWLEGAVKKLDFRTRSALSRRLEKKKLKREKKEKLSANVDTSLFVIEENSKKKNIVNQCLNNQSSSSSKSSLKLDSSHKNQKTNFSNNLLCDFDYTNAKEIAKKNFVSKNNNLSTNLKVNSLNFNINNNQFLNYGFDENKKNQSEFNRLSELEKRAKEQEEELRKELFLKFSLKDDYPNQRLVFDSASSSASSSIVNFMAVSKSLDFRTPKNSLSSSQSNNGSVNELDRSKSCTPNFNTRLSLLQRPSIRGKTGIPLPTPKIKTINRHSNDIINEQLSIDDDCF